MRVESLRLGLTCRFGSLERRLTGLLWALELRPALLRLLGRTGSQVAGFLAGLSRTAGIEVDLTLDAIGVDEHPLVRHQHHLLASGYCQRAQQHVA